MSQATLDSSLLDISNKLSVGIDVLSLLLAFRGIGESIGTIMSGLMFDKLVAFQYTMIWILYILSILLVSYL